MKELLLAMRTVCTPRDIATASPHKSSTKGQPYSNLKLGIHPHSTASITNFFRTTAVYKQKHCVFSFTTAG